MTVSQVYQRARVQAGPEARAHARRPVEDCPRGVSVGVPLPTVRSPTAVPAEVCRGWRGLTQHRASWSCCPWPQAS